MRHRSLVAQVNMFQNPVTRQSGFVSCVKPDSGPAILCFIGSLMLIEKFLS
jgi:hypothetical protein